MAHPDHWRWGFPIAAESPDPHAPLEISFSSRLSLFASPWPFSSSSSPCVVSLSPDLQKARWQPQGGQSLQKGRQPLLDRRQSPARAKYPPKEAQTLLPPSSQLFPPFSLNGAVVVLFAELFSSQLAALQTVYPPPPTRTPRPLALIDRWSSRHLRLNNLSPDWLCSTGWGSCPGSGWSGCCRRCNCPSCCLALQSSARQIPLHDSQEPHLWGKMRDVYKYRSSLTCSSSCNLPSLFVQVVG